MDSTPYVERRLLIVHQGALGDFIVTFPVLKALRVSFDRIGGLCRFSFGRLAVDIGLLDHHFPLESARFASLYADRIDSSMNRFVSNYSHVLLFSFSETLESSMRKIHENGLYRIAPWPDVVDKAQVTEFLSKQVIKCGILPHADRETFIDSIFTAMGNQGKNIPAGGTIVLSPGAGSIKKRWPLEWFLVVAAALLSRGLRPVILLGPAEADIEVALRQRTESLPTVVKCESFPELVTLFDSASAYIGNDSGVTHLASYLGLPVLVIFGASDSERWRPFGKHVRVVTPSVVGSSSLKKMKEDGREPLGMEHVSPERVLTAFWGAFRLDMTVNGNFHGHLNRE